MPNNTFESLKDAETLYDLCKEYDINLPENLQNKKIYNEINDFKDAEYIYCIAYEMLIRTDEYNQLLKEYEPLKNISKYDMTTSEFSKLRELIERMNKLGLKKTSFLGFDCGEDDEHVFKKIEYYDEILKSPWSVRMVKKFQLDSSLKFDSIYHMLIDFYNNKNELYVLKNGQYEIISLSLKKDASHKNKDQINFINNIHISDIYQLLDKLYIPINSKDIKLLEDIEFLKELENDFLIQLKEDKNTSLLIQAKMDFSHYNAGFLNKYYINDIKNGLKKLIEFHFENNIIYNENLEITQSTLSDILKNPSKHYIPCINRLNQTDIYTYKQNINNIIPNDFIKQLENDGVKSVILSSGIISVKKEDHIYLVEINNYLSLSLLEEAFLQTLTYEDLKNTYINTEPLFSRPRLMFDEARLTNIPINLNLSKEDLLLYISQIKEDYDTNKNIVKNDIEYFFNLTLESDLAKMPTNIKYVDEKAKTKRLLPTRRQDFKNSLATAFYIYDLYKLFIPYFDKEIKNIIKRQNNKIDKVKKSRGILTIDQDTIERIKYDTQNDLNNYSSDNLIMKISKLVSPLSEEQVKYYLVTMKEFIHGINKKNEHHPLKKKYDYKHSQNTYPKYKNLIIGKSYILKNTKKDLYNILSI